MPNAFIRKLECFAPLGAADKSRLEDICSASTKVGQGVDLAREGEKSPTVHVILVDFAYRYKSTADGRRQISTYLIPRDSGNLHTALLKTIDHSIGTLTECEVAQIDRRAVLNIVEEHPAVARALWWNALVEASVLREWTRNNAVSPIDGPQRSG